jgi:hypothetical protein
MNATDDDAYTRVVHTREEAHQVITLAYGAAKVLIQDGKRVRITVAEEVDSLSARQRRFLHGVVLPQIAEQVRMPDGTRYVAEVWKTYFRGLFLPDRWVVEKRPRWDAKKGRMVLPKRATPHRERVSTESLSVKQYSRLIDQVLAHAATELGVEFRFLADEREAVRYVAPKRVMKKQPEAETC